MLHITNGDATKLQETGLSGEVIVWRDFLHDGPTPADLELNAMSRVRSEYIHSLHAGLDVDLLLRDFEVRDRALEGFLSHEKVLLWFEADLYVRPLAFAEHPLVAIEQGGDGPESLKFPYRPDDRHQGVRITDLGRAVLAGAVDHIQLNGVDRWRGGVHLKGHEVPWRWDESGQRLVKLQ